MSEFKNLLLSDQLLANIRFTQTTLIQSEAIPLLIEGHDLLGISQTGSGKTAAYTLPILDYLLKTPKARKTGAPRVLILSPTRELCLQIQSHIEDHGKNLNFQICSIYGGVGQSEQVRQLKTGVDIVVATTGRLLDLLEQKQIRLDHVEMFVLDEADRMLNMGFIDDIMELVAKLPSQKQTAMFSATMPPEIKRLSIKLLKNPKIVQATPVSSTVKNIEQRVIFCKKELKFQLLKKILKEEKIDRVLVFTKTKNNVDLIVEYLKQNRMASQSLHGDKSQADRLRVLHNFKDGAMKVLVATDIAARGIDIQGVSHVINFDLPIEIECYVHRIGRTARAGQRGIAISLCEESERTTLESIQDLIGLEIDSTIFHEKQEMIKLKGPKVKAPTPGKSQEKTAYLDHSKRQPTPGMSKKHPGFKRKKRTR